jgi:hypothetical protein
MMGTQFIVSIGNAQSANEATLSLPNGTPPSMWRFYATVGGRQKTTFNIRNPIPMSAIIFAILAQNA